LFIVKLVVGSWPYRRPSAVIEDCPINLFHAAGRILRSKVTYRNGTIDLMVPHVKGQYNSHRRVCSLLPPSSINLNASSSSAHYNPLLDIGFSNVSLDLRLLAFSYCQPSYANCHSTWPEGVLRYVYRDAVSTPELIYPGGCRFFG
jgi:hypothetical protein